MMHLRRVNESLVERVEFFEQSQVRLNRNDGVRTQREGGRVPTCQA